MSIESDVHYLKDIPAFQRLDEDHLQFVASCSETVSLGLDEVIFRKGDRADTFYLVVQGTVGLFEPQKAGREVLVQEVEPRRILGWSWMVPPYEWQFDARVTDPAILMKFDAEKIRARCDQEPAFGYGVMRRIAEQMMIRLHAVRGHMAQRIEDLEQELEHCRERDSSGGGK